MAVARIKFNESEKVENYIEVLDMTFKKHATKDNPIITITLGLAKIGSIVPDNEPGNKDEYADVKIGVNRLDPGNLSVHFQKIGDEVSGMIIEARFKSKIPGTGSGDLLAIE